jgi:hypothetical protein
MLIENLQPRVAAKIKKISEGIYAIRMPHAKAAAPKNTELRAC